MSESGESTGGTNKGLQRIQEAFDKVQSFSFMELDKIIPGDFVTVKAELTKIIVELQQTSNFDDFKNMCDITLSSPKYLMCLFVCGYIQSDSMSLQEWSTKKSKQKDGVFDKFEQSFIAYLKNPEDFKYVRNNNKQQTVSDYKTKAIPADLCIIRDKAMSTKDCVLEIWRDSTKYTDYNIEVWPLFFTLSLQLQSKMGCFGITSGTGASYIFLYNLPDWNVSQTRYRSRKESYWKKYIEDPITLYSSTIEQLGVTQTQIVSNISTSNKEDSVFLYVHLFTLLTFSNYENHRFYSWFHNRSFEFTKRVFRMSGMTYNEIEAASSLNTMDTDQDYPFNVVPIINSTVKGLGRLASKYIDLLTEEPVYSEPVHNFEFFPTMSYKKHVDFLMRDEHAVVYDWVFRNPNLLDDQTWQSHLPAANGDDWQNIGICRRVYHAMWENLSGKRLRDDALLFFVTLEKGRTIENRENSFKEGVVELDLEVDYTEKGITNPNVGDFVQSQTPEVQTAIGSYFGARGYTVSDLAHKYVARLASDNSLIVLDSHDWAEKAGGGSGLPMKNIPLNPLPPEEEPKFGMLRPSVPPNRSPSDITPAVASAEPPSDSEESDTPARPETSMSSRSGDKKYDLDSLIRNLESVTKRHAFEISTRRGRLKGLTALTAEQRKQHQEETKELENLNQELNKIKEDMKSLQENLKGIEEEKNTLETQLQDAKDKNLEIEAEKTNLEETITQKDDVIEEKDKSISEKDEKIKEKDDLIEEKDGIIASKEEEIIQLKKDLEDLEKNNGDNTTQLQEQIKNLEDKIAGLEKDIQDKDTKTGDLETEKKGLEEEITDLKNQNDKLTTERDQVKQSKDNDAQQNISAVSALEEEKENLERDVRNLTNINDVLTRDKDNKETQIDKLERETDEQDEQIDELHKEIETAEEALIKATKDMDKDVHEELKEYDKVMSEGMKIVVTAQMREKLRNGEFNVFYELVKQNPSPKETYSNAALFLVLESMGGTWKMALASRAGKADTEDYDDIITEKIIYDLRQWDAIGNGGKVGMRHTSKDFKAFVVAFGLTDDAGGGSVFRPSMPRTRTSTSYRRPAQPAGD
jgi:predicted  nucleic acid-binding Zn-ribbon protein